MSEPNPLQPDNNSVEAALLRSDLDEIFLEHCGKVALYQPENLELPVELVLAGTFLLDKESALRALIQVRQRIDSNGMTHLVVTEEDPTSRDSSAFWCYTTPASAHRLSPQKERIAATELAAIRSRISPESVIWDEALSQDCAEARSPYAMARV